ncbi:DddA-like double-stranded DNA deaminase toxin [Ruminococcus bicirculans (ex Wegman et al. 2014)]|uniref:DddA-like double-stranded DNA deaminase toxin n=1 Tax=Ruminococcus bicirculans (ex Wegman et al. 2014) TaxID=1160721 RepID=UPI00307D8D11
MESKFLLNQEIVRHLHILNIKQSASHVEGKAALYMRENGINEATVFHNNPNGTCGFCDRQVPALLPKGAKLTVVPPSNSVANNVRAIPVPKTYIGNSTVPKIK